ncbi:MAG: hypothetical protein ABGX74_09810 [Psychrobacter sp.]
MKYIGSIVATSNLETVTNYSQSILKVVQGRRVTSAVNNGEKHLVDFIRQPDGKSLGILEQAT